MPEESSKGIRLDKETVYLTLLGGAGVGAGMYTGQSEVTVVFIALMVGIFASEVYHDRR